MRIARSAGATIVLGATLIATATSAIAADGGSHIQGIDSNGIAGIDSNGVFGIDSNGIHGIDSIGVFGIDSNGIAGIASNTVLFGWRERRDEMAIVLRAIEDLSLLKKSSVICRANASVETSIWSSTSCAWSRAFGRWR